MRLIEYRLQPGGTEVYRLLCSILDPKKAPGVELANLYPKRWTIETVLAEIKTRLRGARVVLRSKVPALVRQDFYGLLLAHFGVRSLIHEAALQENVDHRILVRSPSAHHRRASNTVRLFFPSQQKDLAVTRVSCRRAMQSTQRLASCVKRKMTRTHHYRSKRRRLLPFKKVQPY